MCASEKECVYACVGVCMKCVYDVYEVCVCVYLHILEKQCIFPTFVLI